MQSNQESSSTAGPSAGGRFDRRSFLRTVASGGYALGVAQLLGVPSQLDHRDGEVSITTAHVRSDPDDPETIEPQTKQVPADWYDTVSRAFEINNLLARTPVAGYLGSAVVPGSYDEGSASISVGVRTNQTAISQSLEPLADGIELDVELIDNIQDIEDGIDPENLEPRAFDTTRSFAVPGGVSCTHHDSLATLGPALYHPDRSQPYFQTAEHAFENIDDPTGETVNLLLANGDATALGSVESAYTIEDVAVIEPEHDLEPASWIDAPEPVPVYGQLTRFGIADLVARDEPLEKVGAMTGHTTGHVQGIDATICVTDGRCRHGQLRWGEEMDLTDGDSGSVSYYVDSENTDGGALVAGLNNARTWWPGQSYVWGVSAYHLTEKHGYHF